MADRKNDDSIIDLTEIVEDGPEPAGGTWGEPTSLPAKEAKAPPSPPEKKVAEPPKNPRRESPLASSHFDEIPESPLKKFLLAEDEQTIQFTPSPPQPLEKPHGFPTPSPQPSWPAPEPPRPSPAAGLVSPEPPKPAPEPARLAPGPPRPIPEPLRLASEPPRPPLPNIEAEMRSLREAMLNRVEKWVTQEGTQVLERVGREIFPRVAEEIIRSEPPRPPLPDIEAEMRSLREGMLSRVEKWAAQEGTQVLERVAREIFPRVAEEIIRQEIEKLKKEAEESE